MHRFIFTFVLFLLYLFPHMPFAVAATEGLPDIQMYSYHIDMPFRKITIGCILDEPVSPDTLRALSGVVYDEQKDENYKIVIINWFLRPQGKDKIWATSTYTGRDGKLTITMAN